jgi:bacterioferritin (cytochrome b1)
MRELSRYNAATLVDLLTARLCYERTAAQLYDRIIAKLRARQDPDMLVMIPTLERHAEDEREHAQWLEDQIDDLIDGLGGDVQATSAMAELEARETRGITEIVYEEDGDTLHMFHALFAAELADHAGWDLLVQLADEAGDRTARRELRKRQLDEEAHLEFARRVIESLTRRAVLGDLLDMPSR